LPVPGVLLAETTITNIPTLGGSASEVRALNNSGMVAGFSRTPGDADQHAFLFSGGTLYDLGGHFSVAYGINSAGQICGETVTETLDPHAFLFVVGGNTDLGTLGGSASTALAINDSGQLTGAATLPSGLRRAFLYSGGIMGDLGTLGGSVSSGVALNGAGQVVGDSCTTNDAGTHAFLYTSRSMVDLGTLGGSSSSATTINTAGQVAGEADTTTQERHGFFFDGAIMKDIGTFGGTFSTVNGMNNSGQVVGAAAITNDVHTRAFLYHAGVLTDLGSFGGDSSAAAINNLGQVVGTSLDTSGAVVPFLWQDGVITNLNSLLLPNSGWVLQTATLINDTGQIVGMGSLSGNPSWFLLTLPAKRPPVANAGPDQIIECSGMVTLNGSGSVSPEGKPLTYEWRENDRLLATGVVASVALGLGTHSIVLTVKDSGGATAQDGVLLRLVDTTSPTVACPGSIAVSAGSNCQAPVPNVLPALTANDNCTPSASLVMSQSPAAGTLVNIGTHVITVTVTDASTNTATCTTSFIVQDPGSNMQVTATPSVLLAANHALVPVTISVAGSSDCASGTRSSCQIISVTSNQPVLGPGDKTSPDWVITGDLTVDLRADRVPRYKLGRTYTITVRCTDDLGNRSTGTTTVFVPRK